MRDVVLLPADNARLARLCGPVDAHLREVEQRLGVEVRNRGNRFQLVGDEQACDMAETVLRELHKRAVGDLGTEDVHMALATVRAEFSERASDAASAVGEGRPVRARRVSIKGRTPNQRRYIENIRQHDLNFGIGPAGTGKTYLAVATAVEALETERVRRLVLVRPAVEAGERLGFLPGDLAQKIDPYLRPLYDALYEMLGHDRVARLSERGVIEMAPLAYMRGRTLNESFIILDEAQNTTVEQMKMFLTRIGFGSTAVVTGDTSQVDLPRGQRSGLRHAAELLKDVDGISFARFQAKDVVRHPLVQRIVDAYDREDA
ncbi:MAG: PhoH family protein [Abyssibacter sp.]|uniref:PhoH family protein n=1 Tax=Abyssibacter sp. TaxID=2320200 RepID=UPI002EBBE0DD|nr:PhoH family protein [Pseudomonadota bacterium]